MTLMPAASLKDVLMGSTFIILAFLPLTSPPFVHDLTPLMISSHKLGILKDWDSVSSWGIWMSLGKEFTRKSFPFGKLHDIHWLCWLSTFISNAKISEKIIFPCCSEKFTENTGSLKALKSAVSLLLKWHLQIWRWFLLTQNHDEW